MVAADYVLNKLGIKTFGGWNGAYPHSDPVWGKAIRERDNVQLAQVKSNLGIMPDVRGMGARDAVYMLEQRGLKVKLQGTGHIKKQSIPEGRNLQRGMTCELILE
jgi:cell division protein FtsI (penicillin-binding protein 3)